MIQAQFILIAMILCVPGFAQISGRWTSIDDASGKPRSVVEISERSGKFVGKVIRIYAKPGEDQDPICNRCSADDPRFNQKVIGMEILEEMVKDGQEFTS